MTDELIYALGGHVLNGPCPICNEDPDVVRMRVEGRPAVVAQSDDTEKD